MPDLWRRAGAGVPSGLRTTDEVGPLSQPWLWGSSDSPPRRGTPARWGRKDWAKVWTGSRRTTCGCSTTDSSPGSRANIDHLAVTAGGVHVIDAKKYRGRPQLKIEGGILRPRVERLAKALPPA
ncbi:hypothetical protein GCM10009845_12560 [Pedococcus bigeumensis]